MTCLVALENSSLDEQVTMTATGVSGVTDGGANISAQLDEVFTMEQCLYAIMLASANDIALQIAEHVGGSVDAFVQMMNNRAVRSLAAPIPYSLILPDFLTKISIQPLMIWH